MDRRQLADIVFTRSDGKVISLEGHGMGIQELEGVSAPIVELFSEKNAVGDGRVITAQRVDARTIEIKAKARTKAFNKELRAAFGAFFNPIYTFDTEVIYNGVSRTARECRIKAMSLPTGNVYEALAINLNLYCPMGYMDGGGMHGQDINSVMPGFGFPYVSMETYGMNFSVLNFQKVIQLENTGDAATYIRAVFTVDGTDDVENPSLICNGAAVRVLTTLHPGDRLEIDSERYMIRLNGINALHLMDKDSQMTKLMMPVGGNAIGFDADSHDNQLSVRVYYALRYNGV